MLNGKRFLAIIPARGGSKRLPQKNILPLIDKPLIAWTIEAALASQYIDEIIVSTDDTKIVEIAQEYGVSVPFLRPLYLSSDTATTLDVVIHTINYYNGIGQYFDFIILLQPTSPMRTVSNIDSSIAYLCKKGADAVISVTETEHSPLWANTLPENGDMSGFISNRTGNKRSQELTKFYRLNGAIYICRIKKMLTEKSFFLKENIFAYNMKKEESIDIDTKFDFELCEFFLKK